MLTRRDMLLGALAAGAMLPIRGALAKASQPGTPVNFAVPPGACDCHTHIHVEQVPFFAGRIYTPEMATPEEMSALHKALHMQRVVIVTPSVYGTLYVVLTDGVTWFAALYLTAGIVLTLEHGSEPLVAPAARAQRGVPNSMAQ